MSAAPSAAPGGGGSPAYAALAGDDAATALVVDERAAAGVGRDYAVGSAEHRQGGGATPDDAPRESEERPSADGVVEETITLLGDKPDAERPGPPRSDELLPTAAQQNAEDKDDGAPHTDGGRLEVAGVTEAKVEAMEQRLLDISAAHDAKLTALQTQVTSAVDKLEQLVRSDEERRRTQPSRCTRCLFWLQSYRVRGFRLPVLIGLLSSLVLPEMDAVSDVLVTIEFYEGGDMGWFEASLTILLVSGTFATGLLAFLVGDDDVLCCKRVKRRTCGWLFVGLLAAPFGMSGLAPVVVAALTLYQGKEAGRDLKDGLIMKWFKALEVIFEALPQSILQAYVAVAYGRLNPSDPEHFSRLLCFSISISLLGAGTSGFNFEASLRNQRQQIVRTG
eukprot:COSAG06_NODE_11441_length_1509_cov_3.200709_1_plen_391_part_10